jgi:thioredoxin-related protein
MKKWAYIILLFICSISNGFAQLNTYEFEEIDSLQNIQNKKTIVFIHTDWCKFCQAMFQTTFKNKEVIQNLNESFYFVTFNAEEKRSVAFNSRKFSNQTAQNSSGIHELAIELAKMNNQTTFPTVCVLNSKNEILYQVSNYLPPKDFLKLLEKLKD